MAIFLASAQNTAKHHCLSINFYSQQSLYYFFIIFFTRHWLLKSFRILLLDTPFCKDNIYTLQGIAQVHAPSPLHWLKSSSLLVRCKKKRISFNFRGHSCEVVWLAFPESTRGENCKGMLATGSLLASGLNNAPHFHTKRLLFTLLLSFLYYTLARQ